MNREEFRAVMESLARIELMIKVNMEAKYGRKETNRVYNEIVNTITKEFDKVNRNTLDEPLPGQMTLEDFTNESN